MAKIPKGPNNQIDKAYKNMQDFVNEYLRNGRNALEAYLTVYPNSSREAAGSSALRLLKKDDCKKYLELKEAEYREKYEVTHHYLIENLKWAINDAKDQDDKKNLIKAVEVLSKICGLNAPDRSEVEVKGISINYITPGKN